MGINRIGWTEHVLSSGFVHNDDIIETEVVCFTCANPDFTDDVIVEPRLSADSARVLFECARKTQSGTIGKSRSLGQARGLAQDHYSENPGHIIITKGAQVGTTIGGFAI